MTIKTMAKTLLTNPPEKGFGEGCCLHIVIADHNTEDEFVKFCLDVAQLRNHKFCIELAERLIALSQEQRNIALEIPEEYVI